MTWPFRKRDCEKDGHYWRLENRKGYRPSGQWYRVAEYVEQERQVCRDCGCTQAWKTTYSHGLQGLSLPQEDHVKLYKEGFVKA